MLTASEAIAQIKARKLTALQYMKDCFGRIEALEPRIHAFVQYGKELALRKAALADEEISKGKYSKRLYGMPIGIKDIFNTRHFPTEMGSPIFKGFTPGNDARIVHSLKQEGGIIIGKTVTAEFAVHHPGPTVNPYNPLHTPGTSSSGSAAAVACGMVPIANGSQTAGSTIRPASYCGVYGFKPSFGLLPRTGVLKTVDVLDHVTIFARSVYDIRLAFDIMRVRGNNYPMVSEQLEDHARQKKSGWRIAFIKTHLWANWEGYAKEAIAGFAEKLRNAGYDLSEAEIPQELKAAHDIHRNIYNKALSYYYQDEYRNQKDQLSPVFREMIEDGRKIPMQDYHKGLEQQMQLIHRLDRFFENYDCILTLSTAGEAKKGLDSVDTIDSSLIWTLCHAPTISLPVFMGPNSMPFGAQLVFGRYRDYSMLNFVEDLRKKGLIADSQVIP